MLLRKIVGVSRRPLSLSVRGFKSRFMQANEERQEQKQKEQFIKDIRFFLSKEKFTLHDFHERVIYGLKKKTGLKTMISGGDQEYSELEMQHKICCTFFEQEKSSPQFLKNLTVRQEVATVAQVSEDSVKEFMEKFKQERSEIREMQGLHEWLLSRRDKGEELPQSSHEMHMMLQQDKPKFLQQEEDLNREDITKEQRTYHLRRHHS